MKKLFLTVCLLLWAFSLPAAIITVDVNGQGDYTTIQDGIDAASNGDEVYVLDGTYDGIKNRNLSWNNKHLTVRSLSGPDNCIIDCEEQNRGFNLFDDDIDHSDLIYGFTIKNGSAGYGGGIRATNGAAPTIQNCIIEDCEASDYGAGIYCTDTTLVLNDTIRNNSGDLEGGAGIACKGDVTIQGCTFTGNYIYQLLGDNYPYAGSAIYIIETSSTGNPQIINNEFYQNHSDDIYMPGDGVVYVEEDSYPHNFGDTLKITGNYFHDEDDNYSPSNLLYLADEYKYEITNNVFEDCNPIYNYHEAGMVSNDYIFENNTLINTQIKFSDCDDIELVNSIFMDYTTGAAIYWDYGDTESMEVSHCLFYNNNSNYNYANYVEEVMIIEGEDPDLDASFVPVWNQNGISPCIDAGYPHMTWDADDTPPDIGAKTAVSHSYFYNQYDDDEIDNSEWISFPVLDTITTGYTEALGLLHRQELIDTTSINFEDNILDHVEYEEAEVIYFDEAENEWQNDLQPDGDFHSYQGYKIQLQEGISSASIGITGKWEDESEPIALDVNKENWVGCYLEEPATFKDAFDSIWNEWESIYSEHWAVERPEPGVTPTIVDSLTANTGELYIIEVYERCQLVWNDTSPSPPPKTKEMTDYFTYDKKLDYMAVNIDTVYGDMPEEIAIYDGDQCLGASKVNGSYPVQILAYPVNGSKNGNLDFRLYYGGKNKAKAIKDYRIYEHKVEGYVKRPLAYDRETYVNVRLNTGEAEPDFSFGLLNNYPNPVNSNITHISFAPAKNAQNTAIKIYNVRGQLVRELDCSNAGYNKAGIPTVSWDCKDSRGRKVQNGVYFYKLISGKKQAVKKMVIVK